MLENIRKIMKIPSYVLSLTTTSTRLAGFLLNISKYRYYQPEIILSEPDKESAVLACTQSHVQALQCGKTSGKPAFAIFEDDARFYHDLKDYTKYLPKDWEIIALGVNTTQNPIPVNAYCAQVNFICGSHALLIRNKASVVDSLIQSLLFYDSFVDYGYSEAIVNNSIKCYVLYPFVCKSLPTGISSIRGGTIDDSVAQQITEQELGNLLI